MAKKLVVDWDTVNSDTFVEDFVADSLEEFLGIAEGQKAYLDLNIQNVINIVKK